jgi:hypothetical protein
MFKRLICFVRFIKSEPWWEAKITEGTWTVSGHIYAENYGKWPHILAHVITAWLSAFGTEDGRIISGKYAGELYSPAATFHYLHKKYGGHGKAAY